MKRRYFLIFAAVILLLAPLIVLYLSRSELTQQAELVSDIGENTAILPSQDTPEGLDVDHQEQANAILVQETPTAASNATTERIEPFPDALPCSDHESTSWHDLWNEETGCYYDHTHNHNPFETVLADQIQGWEQTISYPWQTPHENEHKHAGYKYVYVQNPQCATVESGDNCLKYALVQLHIVGSTMGAQTRFHSFRAVAMICGPDGNNCGIAQTGGWADFGVLHCSYKQQYCPLESDPSIPADRFEMPPYRASTHIMDLPRVLTNGKNIQIWNSGILPAQFPYYSDPHNQILQYDWQTADAWDVLDPDDLGAVHFICADEPNCRFNHSTMRMYEIIFRVPEELGDGLVSFSGYTDLQGNIDPTCTAVGSECVPLILEKVPSGSATFRVPLGNTPIEEFDDYDIYFCGEQVCGPFDLNARSADWIKYPN
ncbi:MAG: hypothetical protein IPM53_06740 [Anaerolineaceae bacterium]|nr:hypothetical protein [Anaerolineaceae bacterium]